MMITIPAETTLIGELRSKGRIRVEGHVEGTGDVEGLLLLTDSCVWKGKIIADVVIIEGNFDGDIIARKKLEVHPKARVNGHFLCPEITIREGARVTGELNMRPPEAPIGLLENRAQKAQESARPNKVVKAKTAVG